MPLNVPVTPTISGVSSTGFTVTVGADGNPSGTFYAIQVVTGSSTQWISSIGTLQEEIFYNSPLTQIVTNANPGTTYTVSVSAAIDSVGNNNTVYGPSINVTTTQALILPGLPFTGNQMLIIQKSRELMPQDFSVNTTDDKILAFAEVVLADINFWNPLTNFTTETVPTNLAPVLYFGIALFSDLFFQMSATLQDFDYNDNGLTVHVDQVGKIDISYQRMLEMYRMMVTNYKKTQIFAVGGLGMGTPRFQSQIGQFLKISLGSAFTWNSP